VHENPEYNTFLSALMASKTILYIGFSFTDGSVPPLATSAPGLGLAPAHICAGTGADPCAVYRQPD
jgi:hypothetical protein